MFKKVFCKLKHWLKKDKICIVSIIIGILFGCYTSYYILYYDTMNITPYSVSDIQRLYDQKNASDNKNYIKMDLKDYNCSYSYYENYYRKTYENSEVSVVEDISYSGEYIDNKIIDKKQNAFCSIVIIFGGSIFFGWLSAYLIYIILNCIRKLCNKLNSKYIKLKINK